MAIRVACDPGPTVRRQTHYKARPAGFAPTSGVFNEVSLIYATVKVPNVGSILHRPLFSGRITYAELGKIRGIGRERQLAFANHLNKGEVTVSLSPP